MKEHYFWKLGSKEGIGRFKQEEEGLISPWKPFPKTFQFQRRMANLKERGAFWKERKEPQWTFSLIPFPKLMKPKNGSF